MNTTQRKFALKRVFEILTKRLEEVADKDDAAYKKYTKATTLPIAVIIKGIEQGSIFPRALTKIVDKSKACEIGAVYDLTKLQQSYIDVISPADRPAIKAYPQVKLTNPENPDDWRAAKFTAVFVSNFNRAKKIKIAYKNASDEIMLGSGSEALKAIQDIESKKF